MSRTVALVMAVLMVYQFAGAQELTTEMSRRPRALVYALEWLGALPGMAGCGCLYGVAGSVAFAAAWSGGHGMGLVVVSCVGLTSAALLPAVAAYGTIHIGDALDEHGSKGWAIGGAYAGAAAMAGVFWLGMAVRLPVVAAGAGYAFLLAVPAGAVVGYNMGIPKKQSLSSMERRLEPPGVTFTSRELPDHSVEYGVRVQLASLRF